MGMFARSANQRSRQQAMRDGNWKYFKDETGEYLFDLQHDKSEKNDLKKIYPAIFRKLQQKWIQWNTIMLPPVPL